MKTTWQDVAVPHSPHSAAPVTPRRVRLSRRIRIARSTLSINAGASTSLDPGPNPLPTPPSSPLLNVQSSVPAVPPSPVQEVIFLQTLACIDGYDF